jgi:hypothetical protein
MPPYLVLDTCNLLRLVGKTEIRRNLLQVKMWVEQKLVILLMPETLHKEWKKHEEDVKKDIYKSIKSWQEDVRKRKTIDHPSAQIEEEHFEDLKQKLFSQIKIINDLIEEYAIKLDCTPGVIEKVKYAKANKLAPFHKGKDNTNDAEILYTAAEYIAGHDQKKLVFISDNHTDFAITKDGKRYLHSDILLLFNQVDFDYETDIHYWIPGRIQSGFPRYEQTARDAYRIDPLIKVDKNAPLLHQVHEYLMRRFKDINILPKKLFTEHYPFITGTHFNNYHRPFTLVTDNEELFELITSLTVTPEKVTSTIDGVIASEEDETKARSIFHILAHNFLYHIAYKLEEGVLLKSEHELKECSCDLCQYYAFRFDVLDEKKIDGIDDLPEDTIENSMKIAYVQYKLHNYVAAAKIFHALYQRRQEKDINYYILAYNCRQLGWLISQTLWEDTSVVSWGKSLTEIDLHEVYKACRNVEDDQILKWLHNEEFYRESLFKAYEFNHDISEVEQGKSNGYNESTRKMQEIFLVNTAFLDRNSVVYDVYGMYQPMYELFAESMLASLQWSHGMGGRLMYLNDDLMRHIILSGNHEWMRKLYYRSRLENLPYHPTAPPGRQLASIAGYLLDTLPNFIRKEEEQTDVRFSMFERMKGIVLTATTMLAATDATATDIDSTVEKILHLLSFEKLGNDFHLLETLSFLLARKGELLSEERIRELIKGGIRHKSLGRSDQIFDVLAHTLRTTNRHLAFTAEEFQVVKEELVDHLKSDGQKDPIYLLSTLFGVLGDEHQNVIAGAVASALAEKFNADKFYMAAMKDMIAVDQVLTEKYFEKMNARLQMPAKRHWFGHRQWYTDRDIDHFLNFCFKFNIQIPAELTAKIALLGNYYKWMLDPDNYDYEEFHVGWLSHHFTMYYKRWFRKSEKLKAHLWSVIEDNRIKDAYRTFSMIYAFED